MVLHDYVQSRLGKTERKLSEMINSIVADVVDDIYCTECEYQDAYEELVAEIEGYDGSDISYIRDYIAKYHCHLKSRIKEGA